jgi:hypothetical protein
MSPVPMTATVSRSDASIWGANKTMIMHAKNSGILFMIQYSSWLAGTIIAF